jgi:hypothetical protein
MTAYGTVADAIAARFAPGVVAAPAGTNAIRTSSASLPNVIGATPAVLVSIDAGTLTYTAGTRLGAADWFVRLYYDQAAGGDLERDSRELLDYLTVLVDQLAAALQLSGTVVSAHVTGFRVGMLRYAGAMYTGLELRVHTVTTESWTPTP